jgi:hypothetical protein
MKAEKNKPKPKSLSIEEQHQEASQDETGSIKRYLRLAEKMLKPDEPEDKDQQPPVPKAA